MAGTTNRRAFFTGLAITALALPKFFAAGAPVFDVRRVRGNAGAGLGLPAVAAACMPESLVIEHSGSACLRKMLGGVGYVELRRYRVDRGEYAALQRTLIRCGIQPLLTSVPGIFLFGFETLESREKFWREVSGRPEWLGLGSGLTELAIYRVPE